jgi:hypothetical protein
MSEQVGLAFTLSSEGKSYASMSISKLDNGVFVPGTMQTYNLCEPAENQAGIDLLSEIKQAVEKYRSVVGG